VASGGGSTQLGGLIKPSAQIKQLLEVPEQE